MFQQEQESDILSYYSNNDVTFKVDPKTQEPIPAHADTLWEVEVKTAMPVANTPETPLSQYIDAVLDVQTLMKGLLDLRRQDV
jgi:mediator of RNA polymerase II transcription subunit 18